MRRVDAEGDSRGVRVQKQTETRSRSRLRRAAIEWLERRELLSTSTSTLPTPTVLTPPGSLTQNAATVSSPTLQSNGGPALTAAPSPNSPSVAVDPINPLDMVAVWVDHDPAGYQPGDFTHPVTNYIEGSYSTDGGQTWTALGQIGNAVNIQQDFSETPPTTSFFAFTQTTNVSVAFDRSENFYVLSSTHDDANDAGILDLQRYNFTTAHADAGDAPTYNGTTAVYSWDKTDSAAHSGTVDQVLTPTIAVDTNVPTFTDPTTGATQTDKFSGNIYIAWGEEDSNTYGGITGFNPFTVRMTSSSDQGVFFTHDAYVDNSSNVNGYQPAGFPLHGSTARYTAPQIAISQGNTAGTVTPGQVSIVYDDYGTQAPIDRILDQSDTVGGTSEQFSPPAADLGPSTFATATINGTTVITSENLNNITGVSIPINIAVDITDPKFTTLQDLDVTTTIDYATLADMTVELIPPAAVNTYLTNKFTNPVTGISSYPGFITLYGGSLTGANLGATSGTLFGNGSGTVFDPNAVRSIGDGNTGAHDTGHFKPVSENYFTALQGLTAATLNGSWRFLASYNTAADTSTSLRYVNGVTLNFSSGINPGSTGAEVTVADKNTLYVVPVPDINPTDPTAATGYTTTYHTDNPTSPYYDGIAGSYITGNGTITAPTQGNIPLLPAPVIASDNTLGSFSQYEGRIYVAFTGGFGNAEDIAGSDLDSDIFLLYSDDGGQTWSNAETVNDDNAATDGYSGAAPSIGNNPSLGRTQYQPQIAVDQSTGDVVVSYLDARNDPSDARVATYVSVSNNGAATFASSVYANPTETALDAVSGDTVNLGPLPDNQSNASGVQDTAGYGRHQALIVTNGQITAFWASNQDANVKLSIVDSILSLAAGPVIISSTQGPVGVPGDEVNTTKDSSGTTRANTIQVTFDEPIDPSTFGISNVGVYYKSPAGGASIPLTIDSVTPLDPNSMGAVNFLITFDPTQLVGTTYGYVGTYSYVIYPVGNPNASPTGISDRIRHVITGGTIATGNVMDQNASGVPGQPHDDDYVVGQPTTVPVTYTAKTALPATITKGTSAVVLGKTVITPSMLMSPLSVIDDYLLQPDNGVLPGVTLTLNITYPNDPDIAVFLVAPDGVEVPLFVQTASAGANFTNTTFTDLATGGIGTGTAPFTGSFKPQTTFNTFANDGVTSLGTWDLLIENFGTTVASTGTLNSWSLTLQPPQTNYVTGTLPLIVPGPHLTSTVAVDSAGTAISSGNTNLVLNNTVSTLQLTWDRNIDVSSFTPAQILSIYGPAGAVDLTGLLITPVSVYTAAGQVAYAGGDSANVFDVTFATQQLSGTYTVTLGTGIFATDTSGQDIGVDANLNAGLDTLKGTATNGVTTPVTYTATSPAVPSTIAPATVNTNGTTTPSMLMSPIDVPIDFPIQGDVNGVSGVTLTLNISYPVDPNLVAYLLSPAGTQIRLFTNVGSGTNTANFTNTTFSDTATTLISTAGAPFFGTFLPQEPFGTLNSNGEDSEGTWELVIENEGNSQGTLNSWSLTFQKPTSSTGLAEAADDRTQTSFQIFNLAASNSLANSTWTAVGPAGITTVGATTPVSFPTSSTVVPAVIAAGTTANPTVMLMSPINISQDFAILGDSAAYSGVTLSLDITNTTVASANISAYLQAPDGTRINLFTNVNTPNVNTTTGATINNTGLPLFEGATLSDIANNPIANGAVTFGGEYTPEALFNTLATDGLYTYGTWSLVITNTGVTSTVSGVTTTTFGAATLDDWSLTFQKVSSTIAGEVSTVVVDPSDKTGNTVYVGTASGGVWKTNDFLTTNPAGPTYVPLTQFGPNFSLNIGSIAAIGVNADPSQTILFAGTGFGQEATTSNTGAPNVDLNSGRGVGILRSTDGGVTWTLLDSLVNTDANGNELPESERDHNFVGDTTYKIVVDPTPEVDGDYIVYAALGGPTGGLYQSLDSGNTWQLLSGGIAANPYVTCTDVLLDPSSKSPTTGNLDTLYVAFSNFGVYVSSNQGQTLQLMAGMLGKDPLIVGPGFPTQPIKVGNAADSPNNITGSYIVLAKPALTGNAAEDLAYKGWLFAAVENGNGTFNGLYVTKDNGENWTLVQLPNIPGTNSVKAAVPTNTTAGGNSYDPTSDQFNQEGAYNLTLTIDPTNPNIVYIGGSQNFQQSGMIRVDLTDLYDAHNFTSFSSEQTDTGVLYTAGQGGVTVANPANGAAAYEPIAGLPITDILNLRYAPTDPFNVNATLVVGNVGATGFVNTGTGATWSLFDEPLKAEAGDTIGSTNVHDVIDYVDPITGDVRLLIADDEGIYTALVNSDGTLDNGIGTDFEANYSRNGNLQNEQLLDSAAQPSYVSSQAAGALFYASGQTDLAAQSDMNILTDGNLTWDNSAVLNPAGTSPRNTVANSSIGTVDRSGVGVATDSTGESSPPNVYEFDIPILGGNLTDFFRVNQFGQTTGLANNVNQEYPRQGSNGDAQVSGYSTVSGAVNNGQIPVGNFEVNPLNGNQILIGSATGNLYETTDAGALWSPIGNAAEFQVGQGSNTQIQFSAIAYAAPDPSAQGGVGNLNNFIYVGTAGSPIPAGENAVMESDGLFQNDGRIFVTQAGGQGWMNISSGLDGSSVVGIYPDPDRGSHAAYAVTLTGVFFSPDTIGLEESGQTVWTNITSNLTSIQYNPFGNATYQQSVLAQFLGQNTVPNPNSNSDVFTAQYGGFTSIVADYRYEIPAPTNATEGTNIFYPVLYVSGYGGVFRSIDNGVTWTVFPNVSFDQAPVDGGYLPSVDVTNLSLVLGDINPATGHAIQSANDPEILLASTFGAGDYAIRLAPDVIPNSVVFDTTLPAPNGSDSSFGAGITNVLDPYLDGISEVSNYGDTVTINLYDEIPTEPDGTANPYFGTLLGTGTTNQLGQFVVQIVDSGQDPIFFASSTAYNDKIVGIRATDSSGASGNLTMFTYTLDLITPNTPDAPVLEADYDTGRFNNDDLTNLSVPPQAGPGAPLSIVTPIFDVTTPLPQANPLSPNPISLTIELLQATSPNGPFFVVNSTQTGFIDAAGDAETYMLTDPTIAALAAAGIDQTFYYEALQIDEAGNVSTPASDALAVTIDTIAPVAPTGITLDASTNSGGTTSPPYETDFTNPLFDVTGVLPGDQLLLYRSVNGGAPILVGTGPINNTGSAATLQVTDTLGATSDGVYTYYAAQLDIYGNFSPLTTGIVVTINTQTPPAAPILEANYDTGRFNNDDVTNIAVPAPTPGMTPNFVVPVFDVNTVAPAAGQPAISTVQLFRANSAAGPYTLVGTIAFNGNPAMVTDASLQTLIAQEFAAGTPVDQTFYYEADQINAAGIESAMSPDLAVLVDTVTPPTLPAPTLDPTSNTGLNKSQLITNQTKPLIDFTNLLPGEQAFLYRSSGGNAPILVGTGPINTTGAAINGTIQDTTGATPDGVYQYYVVQQDLAGNISNFSAAIAVTVNTTVPTVPTIALEAADDTGLPSHPNVTSINTPAFVGTAQYNAGTNFPLAIINVATGAVIATTYPAANGTYLAQVTTALPDGVYTLEARTENLAGTFSYSAPLTITILHTGPQINPNLQILPADDTGLKGDNVTSNHNPEFIGTTSPGDTVSLYVIQSTVVVNGVPVYQVAGPYATTTSSTINGSFAFQLPFNLTDGTTQLIAQTSDIANNKTNLSATTPLTIQIVTTTGDYISIGKAQLTVFDPYNETYYVRNIGSATVDNTPGRDVPMQYDLNGDGATDLVAYRFNTAEYYGYVTNNTGVDQQFGPGGLSLPVSGYYGSSGTFIYGSYAPDTGTWYIALPTPGGLVVNFGVPKVDIPVPAAYNGYNSTELAVFRNTTVFGGDADSFSVIGPNGFYEVSFTSPAVQKLGFTYQPGDIAAPGDYDGVGRTEFAIYRPSTGQFFILNTPSDTNTATWTLRTVTLNLPGGPNVNDEPVSQDYDGDGKADPTVYRPSNSTFYMISSATGLQSNIQFGPAGQSVAAAGPILYRLTALFGVYASGAGYYPIITTAGGEGGGGVTTLSITPSGSDGGGTVHAESIASAATSTSPAPASPGSPLSTMIAVAAPIAVTTTPTPAPATPVVSLATTPTPLVTVGASTPKTFVPVVTGPKATPIAKAKPKKETKPLVVDSKSHETEAAAAKAKAKLTAAAKSHSTTAPVKSDSAKAAAKSHTKAALLAVTSLQHLVMAKKGGKKN